MRICKTSRVTSTALPRPAEHTLPLPTPQKSLAKSSSQPVDIGSICIISYNVDFVTEAARVVVAPDPTSFGPMTQTSHAPPTDTGMLMCVPLEPDQNLQVRADPENLNPLNPDSVDIFGTLSVSNADLTEFLVCQYTFSSLESISGVKIGTLKMVRSNGEDLGVNKARNGVVSASGGIFNVVLNACASWS